MNRRYFIKNTSLLIAGYKFMMKDARHLLGSNKLLRETNSIKKFVWGVATAAYQTEGAINTDGKSLSIWDNFSHKKNKIKNSENADIAVDFYNRYREDIGLIEKMNMNAFRFSLSWPRIMPQGTGKVNMKGLDFYRRVINTCLEKGIEPWITLYHWDLPQSLEDKGGWTNRDIVGWFSDYVDASTRLLGDQVKNWIVLNEPMTFTGLGYFTGYHAPGKRGMQNFLSAAHHATLCQAEGGNVVRKNVKDAQVGTAFSFSHIIPKNDSTLQVKAYQRLDALLNRMYIEPALGLGYPFDALPFLRRMEKYFKPGDDEKLKFDFDFHGVQYYFRLISKFSLIPPVLYARNVKPDKKNSLLNSMGFEVHPDGLYEVLKRVGQYKGVKKIIITECGECFDDKLENGRIHDELRIEYLKETIAQTKKAISDGINVCGYFTWSLTDCFEWSEGYKPRFGLIYIDYSTLTRYMKDSALWFSDFLK